MHYFFGKSVFQCMVLAVTSASFDDDDDEFKLTENKIRRTESVFKTAYEKVTKQELDKCPPVVYIGKYESGRSVRAQLKNAPIASPSSLQLNVLDDVCVKCSGKIRFASTGNEKIRTGFLPGNSDSLVDYKKSTCHPKIIPKHTVLVRVLGGMLGLATLYISRIAGVPGFFNDEEICVKCKRSPGSPGCVQVHTDCIAGGVKIENVDHSQTVENYTYVED